MKAASASRSAAVLGAAATDSFTCEQLVEAEILSALRGFFDK
jgi:hypothetical protein